MAFDGRLVQINGSPNYVIDAGKFVKAESYKVLYSVTDYDSYRDANGVLHRNAVDHRIAKVEWETPALLTNTEVSELFREISRRYTIPKERKVSATVYIPETDSYVTQEMYMSDPTMQIYHIDKDKNKIQYNSFRIALIGY